jgi:hypothetical protein
MAHDYEVNNPEIKNTLQKMGGVIGGELPDGWGFALFLFSYGENGSMFYISSAQREDVQSALAEFLQREKEKADA